MEFRIKYRDLPWSVALGVLPGKIIGTFITKPFIRIKKRPTQFILKVLLIMLIIAMLAVIFITIQDRTNGALLDWLIYVKDLFFDWLTNSGDEELSTIIKESGL